MNFCDTFTVHVCIRYVFPELLSWIRIGHKKELFIFRSDLNAEICFVTRRLLDLFSPQQPRTKIVQDIFHEFTDIFNV